MVGLDFQVEMYVQRKNVLVKFPESKSIDTLINHNGGQRRDFLLCESF